MMTATFRHGGRAADLGPVAVREAAAERCHARLVAVDRVQRLNRQEWGWSKDPISGEWRLGKRIGLCGTPRGGSVVWGHVAMPDGSDGSRMEGLATCGSANTCLRCAIKIGAARARQIELVAAVMKALGFECYLVTLTFAHQRNDVLGEIYEAMMDGFTAFRTSRLFRKLTAGGGGFVRQVELTWSLANGWHPHIHVLVWSKQYLSSDIEWGPSEVDRMEHALWVEWSHQMARSGRHVSEDYGLDLVRADDPAMGRYLAKVGLELTMGALKTGRHDSWSTWELATGAMNPDLPAEVRARCRALWRDYVNTVAGDKHRRMFDSSRGLFRQAGLAEIDEQAEAERVEGDATLYVEVEAPVHNTAAKAGVMPEIKGLLASQASPEVLAIVLTRRLDREVLVAAPSGGRGLPILRWAVPDDEPGRAGGGRMSGGCWQDQLIGRLRKEHLRWARTASDGATPATNGQGSVRAWA
ncbi:MAG: protein rep [Acidimicrobiia bacterium]|nr:protein rep [Acidimicrobiia bacterium]